MSNSSSPKRSVGKLSLAEESAGDSDDADSCNSVDRVGELLDSYRSYLCRLAAARLHGKLAQRISPSDVVQETMIAAHRDRLQFRGTTQAEFAGWLRAILNHKLLGIMDRHLNGKRDARREVSIDVAAPTDEGEGVYLGALLASSQPSPSAVLSTDEESQIVARLLGQLPPDYREVIRLRNLKGLQFDAVAQRLNRTPKATRMLWLRAIRRLRTAYEREQTS